MKLIMPSVDIIKAEFDYDPTTGVFINARYKGSTSPKGKISGCINSRGYINLYIYSRIYLAHRLAWKVIYGEDPPDEIDHIDGIGVNNAINNLRLARRIDNVGNTRLSKRNTSGYKGAHYVVKTGRWDARFGSGPTFKYLGTYDTPEEAHEAYVAEAKRYFGRFANDGFAPIGVTESSLVS